jgi:3-oxoacyl-[acyl-carrier-protein] synthase III
MNVKDWGNTSAASIPIAMAEAFERGKLKPGSGVICTPKSRHKVSLFCNPDKI